MPKLVINYMRLVAGFFFLSISLVIMGSYFLIPEVFSITLADFYQQYWKLLTILFVIATIFLVYAFWVERKTMIVSWFHHLLAVIMIGGLFSGAATLMGIADTFLAFLG